jgi:2-oxo-3-hexenedioate decarboxylase
MISEAMTAQLRRLDERLAAGMPRLGWKIGLNVPEVQRQVGLSHALIGWLDGERCYASGDTVSLPAAAKVHAEVELCVRLGRALGAAADRAQALAAVDAVAPAIELVDYGIRAQDLPSVIRCSMFHYGVVLGSWQLPRADIAVSADVILRVGQVQSAPARAELVPAHLGELVLFVAQQLEAAGRQLHPGDLIMSGCFVPKALPLRPGETAEARVADFGSVTCHATQG